MPDEQVGLPVRVGRPCVEAIRVLLAPVAALLLQPPARNATHGANATMNKGVEGGERGTVVDRRRGKRARCAKRGDSVGQEGGAGEARQRGMRRHQLHATSKKVGDTRSVGWQQRVRFFERTPSAARRLPPCGPTHPVKRQRDEGGVRRANNFVGSTRKASGCSRHAGGWRLGTTLSPKNDQLLDQRIQLTTVAATQIIHTPRF